MQFNNKEMSKYQRCSRCVMDTTATDIVFNEKGECNYCTEFLETSSHIIHEDPKLKELRLSQLVEEIKKSGKGKPYDCIVGVSGGVDSSWTLVQAKRLGLRPLAVHMDNGWNSELAQNNIGNLVQNLGVDLFTHVIDWEEYRGLMQAFFDADVIDIELLYDNAMLAVNYNLAKKYKIKYILSGCNSATEGMRMPPNWNWYKWDRRNILDIAKKHGVNSLKTFPSIGTIGYLTKKFFNGIKWIATLDYIVFNKFDALDQLESEFGYKRYPFKHYESVFTRFYQGFILPNKFGVDKRILHLATLVASGQMKRNEALNGLTGIAYASEGDLQKDKAYFLKKMKWSEKDLNEYLSRPVQSHENYHSEKAVYDSILNIKKKLKLGN